MKSHHSGSMTASLLVLSLLQPLHSFAAYGVGSRPAFARSVRPPALAVALPLTPPVEVLYDGQCMVSFCFLRIVPAAVCLPS